MAASLWWVCLCFTWFLAAALKWSKEAITKKAPNLHLVSWGLPAFKTVLALSLGHVEGSGSFFLSPRPNWKNSIIFMDVDVNKV